MSQWTIFTDVMNPQFDLSEISPCVWLFERLNIDTLGRFALCGQDIGFKTAHLFPTIDEITIEELWNGETFKKYGLMYLAKQEVYRPAINALRGRLGLELELWMA